MSSRPNLEAVLATLKDFQRATVDYAFSRLEAEGSHRRFLVADEVGLGKTLVARGVIAKTIDRLWDQDAEINIVYICSNADIARQNIQRLSFEGLKVSTLSTRLTLLPIEIQQNEKQRVNFVALTPGTSFEQAGDGGRAEERVFIYWLLNRAWKIDRSRSSLHVLRDYSAPESFQRKLESFSEKLEEGSITVNEALASRFLDRIAEDEKQDSNLKQRFESLCKVFSRADARVSKDDNRTRSQWIGDVRRLLAEVCLEALDPDLIVLDEFQRFKHLLDEKSEAGELARKLFKSGDSKFARVLLLSATPYRSLTLNHEAADHYEEFIDLIEFLKGGTVGECKNILSEYREALSDVATPSGRQRLLDKKSELECQLRGVMARTEKSSVTSPDLDMFSDATSNSLKLDSLDVASYLSTQRIASHLGHSDVVEFWKSAPYLFNFMDNYSLKGSLRAAREDRDLIKLVRQSASSLLDVGLLGSYGEITPKNPRLRSLLERTVQSGMWQLLWMPPSINYYLPAPPYTSTAALTATKQLLFSSWHVVPRSVAPLVSYEVERQAMHSFNKDAQASDWEKQGRLLRFNISEGRLTGLPLFLLIYPCLTFARDCDPRDLAREKIFTSGEAIATLKVKIEDAFSLLNVRQEERSMPDERWYWLLPMLLDQAKFSKTAFDFTSVVPLDNVDAELEDGEETQSGWAQHIADVAKTLNGLKEGTEVLGPLPPDLFDVVALAASAAPGTVMLRALLRNQENAALGSVISSKAMEIGRAFFTLFNHADTTAIVRSFHPNDVYWKAVLKYSHAGNLQSTFDEYLHIISEGKPMADEKAVVSLSSKIVEALTLRAASMRVDNIAAPPYVRELSIDPKAMRLRYALRFGDDRAEDKTEKDFEGSRSNRRELIRTAFNSPFWPFVLISTSVGQEGLDFHNYCHSITHWNLPSNPVDLEQREGRVHRFKGHAIRKNVANAYGSRALAASDQDVWSGVFQIATSERKQGEDDLVPFWIFPGKARIERHIPALPYSLETERTHNLRRSLAVYRMVFGQSRQEDLMSYLLKQVPDDERSRLASELRIDLRPRPLQ